MSMYVIINILASRGNLWLGSACGEDCQFFQKNESYSMLTNIDAYTQISERVTVIGRDWLNESIGWYLMDIVEIAGF